MIKLNGVTVDFESLLIKPKDNQVVLSIKDMDSIKTATDALKDSDEATVEIFNDDKLFVTITGEQDHTIQVTQRGEPALRVTIVGNIEVV